MMPGLLAITNGTDSITAPQQHNQLFAPISEPSGTIPEQSAPEPEASIPPAATSPADLAAGLIKKLSEAAVLKRPAACESDLEPAPKKPKTKPPTAPKTKPAAGAKPASTSKGGKKAEPASTSKGGKKAGAPPGNTKNMPLGAFPGVPKKAAPRVEYKDFRVYTSVGSSSWRAMRKGERLEILLDAHDNYIFALWDNGLGTMHRIFLGALGFAFKTKNSVWVLVCIA